MDEINEEFLRAAFWCSELMVGKRKIFLGAEIEEGVPCVLHATG